MLDINQGGPVAVMSPVDERITIFCGGEKEGGGRGREGFALNGRRHLRAGKSSWICKN